MGCIRFSWRVRLQIGHHRGMKVLFALLVLCLSITAVRAQGACPPPGWSLERLQGLKSRKWQVEGDTERNDLARQLLPCLAARDPVLRDDLAFEALQAWMRGKALAGEQIKSLGASLLERMQAPDAEGIGQPFAALAMSEVARADRLQPLWSAAERQAVVEASAAWMKSRRDYRGFEPGIGWRHAVAHGADLLLQLTLNPQLDKAQLESILDAVVRETLEETGLAVTADVMLPFAHWTTPIELPKRFATWFFAAPVVGADDVRIDNSEIIDYRWLTPAAALELQAACELELPAPTYVTLLGFSVLNDIAALVEAGILPDD